MKTRTPRKVETSSVAHRIAGEKEMHANALLNGTDPMTALNLEAGAIEAADASRRDASAVLKNAKTDT